MNIYLDKLPSLTPQMRFVMCDQGTEAPHSGEYNQVAVAGSYLCRRCGLALFRADSQFTASCGWPSFDEGVLNNIKELPDIDGQRTEIRCDRCGSHLGHVFVGEYCTDKNKRYCVNSLALDFVADSSVLDTQEAILAGGCFWGVDYYLSKMPGVLKVEVGYMGGRIDSPTYLQVCEGNTGHYEVVRVLFDVKKIDYETVLKRFFEIHDPTQTNGQGPDLGLQYQSAIFFYNPQQMAVAEALIQQLNQLGYAVATAVLKASIFWRAEDYHQNYYFKNNHQPYCHKPVKRW